MTTGDPVLTEKCEHQKSVRPACHQPSAEARAFAAQHLRAFLDASALDQAIEDLQRLRRRISTQAFDRLVKDDPVAASAEVQGSMRAATSLINCEEGRILPSHQDAEEYDHAVARHREQVAHHQRERLDTIRPYVAEGTPGGKTSRLHHVTCDRYAPIAFVPPRVNEESWERPEVRSLPEGKDRLTPEQAKDWIAQRPDVERRHRCCRTSV
ncbi:hypothetical protein K7B06_00035 [Streptomyces erythrochromogenes]|nr:hypothetical protein [Streptomyces erythrochromogenes]